jgi:hypothetical protein
MVPSVLCRPLRSLVEEGQAHNLTTFGCSILLRLRVSTDAKCRNWHSKRPYEKRNFGTEKLDAKSGLFGVCFLFLSTMFRESAAYRRILYFCGSRSSSVSPFASSSAQNLDTQMQRSIDSVEALGIF